MSFCDLTEIADLHAIGIRARHYRGCSYIKTIHPAKRLIVVTLFVSALWYDHGSVSGNNDIYRWRCVKNTPELHMVDLSGQDEHIPIASTLLTPRDIFNNALLRI